ncbi:TPA: hypothetical protein L3526_004470 [Escherichia coli]|nr:hypothetical protein [Escherichia coli]
MTRFHCVLQRRYLSGVMRSRYPMLTLGLTSQRPLPGDELEITIANHNRSTETIVADILMTRVTPDKSAMLVTVRPRLTILETEAVTPVGKIMAEYREKQTRKNNEELTRKLAVINRKAAIASYVHSAANRQSRR